MSVCSMKTIVIVSIACALSSVALAASKTTSVKPFQKLAVEDGFLVKVGCGSKSEVDLSSNNADLSQVAMTVDNGTLKIKRQGTFKRGDIEIDVTTANRLTTVSARDGIDLKVKACAVNKDQLTVNLANGVKAKAKGKTKVLNLNMSKGATFGDDDGDLKAGTANVDVNMGVKAYVCGAKTVTGRASMGAIVHVADGADSSGLTTSMGAMKSDC